MPKSLLNSALGYYRAIMVPFHDQIRTVESAPPDTRKSPVLSNVTEWTASSWPTKVEIWEQELIVKSIQKIIEGCYMKS